jgi:hypothetical protein
MIEGVSLMENKKSGKLFGVFNLLDLVINFVCHIRWCCALWRWTS